ncbi:hypothetical protein [Terribacillus saccharophilus]|uniref:hypothetical protein n=1 Tax=Terribacillus saccharophilus TaxID=361277 RepID=UPI001C3EC982|nr:hypothetical protein [Terribacillus saccharophilus]
MLYYFHTENGINDTLISSFISAIGGIIGGLIGGIVAFIVSKIQIQNVQDTKRIDELRKYLNVLKSLIIEIEYNIRILRLISRDKSYITSLESEIWYSVRFDANNFLPNTIFNQLTEEHREIKDMKAQELDEYKDELVNIDKMIATNEKIVSELKKIEDKVKDSIGIPLINL